jgi:hypothetical protein
VKSVKSIFSITTALLCSALAGGAAQAQSSADSYPDHPIKLVVG